MLIKLYRTFARSFLDYASVIYSSHFMYLIDAIKGVRRHFTKRLHGLKDMSYTNRLNICNIESLKIRRLHTDLITLNKIIHGIIDCNSKSFNFNSISNQGNRTRGNSYKLVKSRIRLDIRKFFFCNRVVDIWNCLSNDIVNCTSVKMFACKLKKYNFSKFIRGQTLT